MTTGARTTSTTDPIEQAIDEMARTPRSSITMCHEQTKTAVYMRADDAAIVEEPPREHVRAPILPSTAHAGERDPTPELTIVIGANGAGKTTWTTKHRHLVPKPFLNPDAIADGLGDANDRTLQRRAGQITIKEIEKVRREHKAFGFESTYSGRSRPALVERVKREGYLVNAVFIGTSDYSLNLARVRRRALEGGHDVPPEEIVRRWQAAQENLLQTWDHFDYIVVVDSSGTEPRKAATKRGGHLRVEPGAPLWARTLVERVNTPLSRTGI